MTASPEGARWQIAGTAEPSAGAGLPHTSVAGLALIKPPKTMLAIAVTWSYGCPGCYNRAVCRGAQRGQPKRLPEHTSAEESMAAAKADPQQTCCGSSTWLDRPR